MSGERRARCKPMAGTVGRREDGRREGRVRRGRGVARGSCAANEPSTQPLRDVRSSQPWLRRWRGPAAVAGAGPGHHAGGAGGRRPAGDLQRAWGGRRPCPVGPSRRRAHLRLRRDRGLVGDPVLQAHGDPADADRVAHRRVDHHPGLGRRRRQLRPDGRAGQDRDRRDLLQEGPLFRGSETVTQCLFWGR